MRGNADSAFLNTSRAATRLQKVIHFQMLFQWFWKSWKFQDFFEHPKRFKHAHFEIHKIGARQTLRSLLFRANRRLPLGRCSKNQNWHSRALRRSLFFVLPAEGGDAKNCMWCHLLRGNRDFRCMKIQKLHKKCCSRVGLKRRNLENVARGETAELRQCFSFKIEDVQTKVT